jgi:hypothetical protein
MRLKLLALATLSTLLLAPAHARKPLIGGPKTIPLGSDGTVPGVVVGTQAGMGGYVSGAQQVAVPLVAVAFEVTSKARISSSFDGTQTTRSLQLKLKIDDQILQDIANQVQGIVEEDLRAQGFAVLPKDSIDTDPRWLGIAKDASAGTEVKDNFMSGFAGNGTFNRWYTAGNRPLFGTGSTAALSELSPLIHIAREKKISLLFYRFKVQFSEIDSNRGIVFNYVKGKNVLHLLNADMAVFTPKHTLASIVKLKADLTAGSDFIQELDTRSKGDYVVVADPARYSEDSLRLIRATSRQFAEFLKKAQ